MSIVVRGVLTWLILALVGLVGLSPTASAESAWGLDRDGKTLGTPAARWNIESSAVFNRLERIKFRVNLERVAKGKTRLFFRARMAERPRWALKAIARRPESGTQNRLWLWPDTSERQRVRCPGMDSRWIAGKEGHVVLRIPHTCLDGPHAWEGFRYGTFRGDAVKDRTRHGVAMEAGP